MIKYYKYNVGKRKKVFLKISANPEDIAEPFKKFKGFISFKELRIEPANLGSSAAEVFIGSGMTKQHDIDNRLRLYKAEEISEEEYLDALFKIDSIKQEINRIFKEL